MPTEASSATQQMRNLFAERTPYPQTIGNSKIKP